METQQVIALQQKSYCIYKAEPKFSIIILEILEKLVTISGVQIVIGNVVVLTLDNFCCFFSIKILWQNDYSLIFISFFKFL